jgi:hypothetical protein
MFTFMWKKSFRDISDFKNIPPMNDEDYAPELLLTDLVHRDGMLECYGLGDGSKVYSYDREGNFSQKRVPYLSEKAATGQSLDYFKRTHVYGFAFGTLYCTGDYQSGRSFFQPTGSQDCMDIEGFKGDWGIRNVYEGLGQIFCWVIKGKDQLICILKRTSQDCRLEEIARYHRPDKTSKETPMAFDEDLKRGLFSANGELYLLKETDGRFFVEKALAAIPSGASINGILNLSKGRFVCIAPTAISSESVLKEQLTSQLNLIEIFMDSDSARLRTVFKKTGQQMLNSAYKSDIVGLSKIDDHRFGFCAGLNFYICSAAESEIIYSKALMANCDELIITKDMALCSRFYYGAVFGLHLGRFNKDEVD